MVPMKISMANTKQELYQHVKYLANTCEEQHFAIQNLKRDLLSLSRSLRFILNVYTAPEIQELDFEEEIPEVPLKKEEKRIEIS
jgi:hypothetical protein